MKATKKTWLAVLLSSTMVVTAGAAAISFMNTQNVENVGVPLYATTASAKTASVELDAQKNLATDEDISGTHPLTLAITDVSAGQYLLSVNVRNVPAETTFELVATVDGEAFYLDYEGDASGSSGVARGVIRIGEESSSIILSVSTEATLKVDVNLDDLFLGPEDGYALSGIQLTAESVAIDLSKLTAGTTYTLSIDAGYQGIDLDHIAASLNGVPLELTPSATANVFTADLTVSNNTSVLSLRTSNVSTPILVSVSVEPKSTVASLPEATTLTMWEPVTYYYVAPATATGYQKINYTSGDSSAEVEITFSTTEDPYDGFTVVGDNYPLHMVAGARYYFDVVLTNASADTAAVSFTISNWEAPEISVNEMYYVPVTVGTEQAMQLNLADGNYSLSVLDLPFDFAMEGYSIFANITATPAVPSVELNAQNGYTAEVELSGATYVSFTTTQMETVAGISFSEVEERNEIVIGTEKQIVVPAKPENELYSTAVYYLTAPDGAANYNFAGSYDITLSDLDSYIIEVVSTYTDVPFVAQGSTNGSFVVQYDGEYALVFRNYGTTEATFNATVTKVNNEDIYSVSLGEQVPVTVNSASSAVRYYRNLVQGSYTLHVSGATAALSVSVDGTPVTITNGVGKFTVSNLQELNGVLTVIFTNSGATSLTLTVSVTPDVTVKAGETVTIESADYSINAGYNLELAAGTYVIALNTPTGMNASVRHTDYSLENPYIIQYGNVAGVFTVTGEGNVYVPIKVEGYGSGETDTMYMEVYALNAANVITLDHETTVSVPASFATTYMLANLPAGKYSIQTSENVVIAANGVVTDGSFEVLVESENVYLTFINKTNTVQPLAITVSETESYFMVMGTAKSITLAGYGYREYFINLAEGVYNIALDKSGVQVYVNGELIVAETATSGVFKADGGVIAIAFTNYDYNETTFTATVTALPTIPYDVDTTITVGAGESVDYYVVAPNGTNYIDISSYSGNQLTVAADGTVILSAGQTEGSFTVENGFVKLTFTNSGDTAITFTVAVYAE